MRQCVVSAKAPVKHVLTSKSAVKTFDKMEMTHELLQCKFDFSETQNSLLPIKTKTGKLIIRQSAIKNLDKPVKIHSESEENYVIDIQSPRVFEEIGLTDILVKREETIEQQKFLIGVTCASIQENPETRIEKLVIVLDLIAANKQNGEKNVLVIRKLALISVAELFKDIIPEYKLGITDGNVQKMKKNTISRVNFETKLLMHFHRFLEQCESYSKPLFEASKKTRTQQYELAEIAVQCMCDLLVSHPYFKYSANTAQILVKLLNCDILWVRTKVYNCFATIFKMDTRADISLTIVRSINRIVKKSGLSVHIETISCLKYLPIIDIDIDKEASSATNMKQLSTHKTRVCDLSKKERKRKKKLLQVENELFETRADENKIILTKKKSELTKSVFTTLFRVLKLTPVSKLLSVTLEAVSRFAHAINFDFLFDMVEILNSLLNSEKLGHLEELHCIQAVFAMLNGRGEIINIDPVRFYTHLYKNLLKIHAGVNHEDFLSILKIFDNVLLNRRKDIAYIRYLAFLKRISIMTLQLLHNGSLGCLSVIKSAMTLNSALDVMLDTESVIGMGNYNAELHEPDYSCANCSNLFELSALHRHYHPCVRRLSNNIVNGIPITGPGSLPADLSKMSAIDFYNIFDCSKMIFNPPIPSPNFCVI